MTLELARQAITTQFKNAFQAASPSTKVKYENLKFTQPTNTPWVEFYIMNGTSHQANLGETNVTERFVGYVQISIFTPEDSGSKDVTELSELVGRIFSRQQLNAGSSAIVFKTPDYKSLGSANGFTMHYVRIPFRRDQLT